jgi:predicted outer membrane protein
VQPPAADHIFADRDPSINTSQLAHFAAAKGMFPMRTINALRNQFALAFIVPASVCFAQNSAPATTEGDETRTATTVSASSNGSSSDQAAGSRASAKVSLNIIDQKLALSLAVDAWAQIETGELALKTVRNEPLKRVIAARVESLRAFYTLLNEVTGGRTGEAVAQAVREIEQDAKGAKARTVNFRPLALNRNATAMIVRIRLEILQQYTDLVQADLDGKSGEEFDKHYLRGELLHQMQLLAMLQVFESQASPDFGAVIHDAVVSAQDHLSKSRQTLVQMETLPLAGGTPAPLSEATAMP